MTKLPPPKCPKCSAPPSAVRIVVYGHATEPSDPARYVEGGWAVDIDAHGKCVNPRFACTNCGHVWGRASELDRETK